MILVAGSANLDFVVRANHIPAPGETVLGRDFKTFPGGKGANQAIACARAGGVATDMLLALGRDAYAAPLEASLAADGVTMHIVRADDEPTGTAFICVSDDSENAITVAPGANLKLRPQHLPALTGCSHLLMQLETPVDTVLAYARAARQAGVQVVLNAAPAQALPAELLGLVDVLVVNEGELAVVAGHAGHDGVSVAACLASLDVPCVVVTLGSRGCVARVGQRVLTQAAFPVKPLDTTAAGDTFCGTLAAALSLGQTLPQALARASAAGALACTALGAQSSIPRQAEVAALVAATPATSAQADADLRKFCGFAA